MTKILEKEIQKITGRMQKNVLTEDSIYAALVLHNDIRDLFRSWVSKIESENFPIGERKWCKKCAKRITKYLLEEKQ